ncbi:hypothetical protein V8F33_006496 [Rhypophila sp. PSN 637]
MYALHRTRFGENASPALLTLSPLKDALLEPCDGSMNCSWSRPGSLLLSVLYRQIMPTPKDSLKDILVARLTLRCRSDHSTLPRVSKIRMTTPKQNNLAQGDIDPGVKIKASHSWLSAMIEAFIGIILWVVVVTPCIIRRSVAFLGGRLAFENLWAFGASVRELLTMPVFENDGSEPVKADSGVTKSGDGEEAVAVSRDDVR